MQIQKVLNSINDRTIFKKICSKIHSFFPLYFILNKNIVFDNSKDRCFRKYKKKYSRIVRESFFSFSDMEKSKKVWICWFQGMDDAPEVVRICYNSIKKCCKDKEIIVLTQDNIDRYTNFPVYIKEKWQRGLISAAHYSDLLRAELLSEYGGIWIDATVLCTSEHIPEYITDSELFVFKNIDLNGLDTSSIVASSWFISCYSHHPILMLTRKLLWKYWEKKNTLDNYFLFHIFFTISSLKYSESWNSIPVFNNVSPHILQTELNHKFSESRWIQLCEFSKIHKLNHHVMYSDDSTFYSHIKNLYLNEGVILDETN